MNKLVLFLFMSQTLQDSAEKALIVADRALIIADPNQIVYGNSGVGDKIVSISSEALENNSLIKSDAFSDVSDTSEVLNEDINRPMSYDKFKNDLVDYYLRNYVSSPFSMGSTIGKLKFLISNFEFQDEALNDFRESCCQSYGKFGSSLVKFISYLYSDDTLTSQQIQSKVPKFLLDLDTIFGHSYSNLLYSYDANDYDFFQDLYLIASYHLEKGNIVASGPRHFVFKIFYTFVDKSLKFLEDLENHPEFLEARSENIKKCTEELKEAIKTLTLSSSDEVVEASILFAKSCKVFIDNALIAYGAENIAFGNEQGFTEEERRTAFDLVIRSKVIVGIIDAFTLFLVPLSDRSAASPDFEDLKIFLTNYFFDYNKIGCLNKEASQASDDLLYE